MDLVAVGAIAVVPILVQRLLPFGALALPVDALALPVAALAQSVAAPAHGACKTIGDSSRTAVNNKLS
jgi:hypothetical protein